MGDQEIGGLAALCHAEHTGRTQIELKIRIPHQDEAAFLRILSSAHFVYEVDQREHYLDNPNRSYFFRNSSGLFDATEFLRVRESIVRRPYSPEPCQRTLCYKRLHRDGGGGYLYCDEYETAVSNSEHTLRLLQNIGFTQEVLVRKNRKVFSLGNYAISVDSVEELGSFVEVEAIRVKHFPQEELEAIRAFITEDLGLRSYEEQTHGYVVMLMNRSR